MNIILTHTDFDGVISSALLSLATGIDFIKFLSNNQIWYENLTGQEVISDLPCPWKCSLWFDHHESNLKEMKERGVDTALIPGKFEIADSCARIIYEHFRESVPFPHYFEDVIRETDKIDSMKYDSLEEWLRETPVKCLSNTVQLFPDDDYRKFLHYLLDLAKLIKRHEPQKILEMENVKKRCNKFRTYKEESTKLIRDNYYFHTTDSEKKMAVLDLSEFKTPARIDKNFVYIIEPEAECVLFINAIFKNNVKTNDLKFSMGINFTRSRFLPAMNIAKIFEELELGGGHSKTAGGILHAATKLEKLEKKENILKQIVEKWYNQKKAQPVI
ncbi:MAG: hypothetical protein PHF84_00290 [bacterium]|nr:hypothetical protein [bacterium]